LFQPLTMSSRLSVGVVGALLFCTVAACKTTSPTPIPTAASIKCASKFTPSAGLAIVYGNRQNSPAPVTPAAIQPYIQQTARGGGQVTIIELDGMPYVVWPSSPEVYQDSGPNGTVKDQNFDRYAALINKGILDAKPRTREVDILGAVNLAARAIKPGGMIVIIDSGLSTVAPLDFSQKNALTVDPTDESIFVSASRDKTDLKGKSVEFFGLGSTAAPQPALDPASLQNLLDVWGSIFGKFNAGCSELNDSPVSGASAGGPHVAIVPINPPTNPAPVCGDTVLTNDGDAGFVPNEDKFLHPKAAEALLSIYAKLILNNHYRVKLTGMTASDGSTTYRLNLSRSRAAAIKAVLVHDGVSASTITAVGVGTDSPYHVPDLDKKGVLLPIPAQENRAVIVHLYC
jgi:OmpA-OmpF porin, OOP family